MLRIAHARRSVNSHAPQASDGADGVGDEALPVGLDPQQSPIIATHFYGWCPVGDIAAEIVQDLAFRRTVKRQHVEEFG